MSIRRRDGAEPLRFEPLRFERAQKLRRPASAGGNRAN
jgi:hypothetical protein